METIVRHRKGAKSAGGLQLPTHTLCSNFKLVQIQVVDISNKSTRQKMLDEAAHLRQTSDMEQWDTFTSCELGNIKGWK